MVRFSVIDTGIGIPAGKQSDIFEAFKQADGSTSRKYGGTGLGLSISRQLVTLLGGEIQLESEEGKGSTFSIYLPATYPQSSSEHADDVPLLPAERYVTIKYHTIPAAPPEHIKALLKNKKILIVDDDERNIVALQMVLEQYGPELITAPNGKDALRTLETHPDANMILMDVMMPEMDGYETIKRIRQKQAHKKLPIIVLTAKAMKSDLEKCLEVGASDYLSKPIDVQQLLAVMEVWLAGKRP